jgi:hypothetical protein
MKTEKSPRRPAKSREGFAGPQLSAISARTRQEKISPPRFVNKPERGRKNRPLFMITL